MIIGVPKEIKAGEMRVALTPDAVRNLSSQGHTVLFQTSAGEGAGFNDTEYLRAGATLAPTAAHAYNADLVVKVKEIQTDEWQLLRRGGMLFSFLHLGADHIMARELLDRRITGIAFETVADRHGKLPILAPMSEIAGELAVPIAANLLMKTHGGKGVMLRGAHVLVVGAGVAGRAAARAAANAGAQVSVVVRNRLTTADFVDTAGHIIQVIEADAAKVGQLVRGADVVIGAVNIPGKTTPKLLTREDICAMQPGGVLIEICIDGGGISATSRPTYHAAPTYIEAGITHYCVANIPTAVPRSASIAISSAILPYVESLANDGLLKAMRDNDGYSNGLQIHDGRVTHAGVAAELNLPFFDLDAVLFSC
jgi:alanine dehydrogenase